MFIPDDKPYTTPAQKNLRLSNLMSVNMLDQNIKSITRVEGDRPGWNFEVTGT